MTDDSAIDQDGGRVVVWVTLGDQRKARRFRVRALAPPTDGMATGAVLLCHDAANAGALTVFGALGICGHGIAHRKAEDESK